MADLDDLDIEAYLEQQQLAGSSESAYFAAYFHVMLITLGLKQKNQEKTRNVIKIEIGIAIEIGIEIEEEIAIRTRTTGIVALDDEIDPAQEMTVVQNPADATTKTTRTKRRNEKKSERKKK